MKMARGGYSGRRVYRCWCTRPRPVDPELVVAIADLRDTLGADPFDALAGRGQAMEPTAMFRYALEQVDAARDAF